MASRSNILEMTAWSRADLLCLGNGKGWAVLLEVSSWGVGLSLVFLRNLSGSIQPLGISNHSRGCPSRQRAATNRFLEWRKGISVDTTCD